MEINTNKNSPHCLILILQKHNRKPTVRIAKPDDKEKDHIQSGTELYLTQEEIIRKFNSYMYMYWVISFLV